MQELIKYISDILNIKTESVYTIQDMTEELSKVKDIVAYRSYIKDNLNNFDYKTGFQKFVLLTQQYLQLEYVAVNPETEKEAEQIRSLAYNIISNGKYNGLASYYGTREDKDLISSIGGSSNIQKKLDEGTLKEAIIKKLIEKDNALIYNQLPQRMTQMLNGTTRAIR